MYDSLTTENTKMDLKNIRFEGFYWYAKLLSFLAIAILDKDCFLAIFALLIPFLYLKKVTQKKNTFTNICHSLITEKNAKEFEKYNV